MITEYDILDEMKKRMASTHGPHSSYIPGDNERAFAGAMAHYFNEQQEVLRRLAIVVGDAVGEVKKEEFKRDFLSELKLL